MCIAYLIFKTAIWECVLGVQHQVWGTSHERSSRWQAGLGISRGTCGMQGLLCGGLRVPKGQAPGRWMRALAFGGTEVSFSTRLWLFSISLHVFPVTSASNVLPYFSCMRKSCSYSEITWKLNAMPWKTFSPDLCVVRACTWLGCVGETCIKAFLFLFIGWSVWIYLVVWVIMSQENIWLSETTVVMVW